MSPGGALLHEALRSIEVQAAALKTNATLSSAFYHWAMRETTPNDQLAARAEELRAEIAGSGRSIQALGALGFLLGVSAVEDAASKLVFLQGVDWLVGRSGDSQTAVVNLMQPVAQTGVLVGLMAARDSNRWKSFGSWFAPLFSRYESLALGRSGWHGEMLAKIHERSQCDLTARAEWMLGSSAAVLYAARGLVAVWSTVGTFDAGLLGRIMSVVYEDAEEAVLDLAAFRFLAKGDGRVDLRAPAIEDVANVLRQLQAGLRRWTWEAEKRTTRSTAQKWNIQNEYHFQNLLCAILTPVFPATRDEEWLPSVGQKTPRADLVLPPLHLVIEVKYWRADVKPQDLISEIAEDASLYRQAGSPYRSVLPVIWDDGRRSEQHALLVAGLSALQGVVSPVIVVRPAFMDRVRPE